MLDLTAVAQAVHRRLEAKHDARERALRESRAAIRHSANAIRAAHRGEVDEATGLLADAERALTSARDACAGQPEVEHAGFLRDAEKEYAEARTTLAIVTGAPLPGPDELGLSDAAWLNGLAETVGELRRHLLDVLRAGRLGECEALLGTMDDIYALLVTIDFPDGVTGGLRRSTDVARSIIERTRGDLTTALVQAQLRDALDAHRRDLLGS
jgi:translin